MTATLTLAQPEPALVHGPGVVWSGHLCVADIGLPAALYASMRIAVGAMFVSGRFLELDRTS